MVPKMMGLTSDVKLSVHNKISWKATKKLVYINFQTNKAEKSKTP